MKLEDKEWYDVVFAYWAQIAVLLGIVGFYLKTIVELRSKKNEIRFSRLHENKILEIKTFYKSYQALRIALQQFHFQTWFREHNQDKFNNLSQDIANKFIDFEYNSMTIRLFVDQEDIAIIDKIMETLSKIHSDLQLWHINAKSANPASGPDKIEDIEVVFKKDLPALINKIEISLRDSFNRF